MRACDPRAPVHSTQLVGAAAALGCCTMVFAL